MGVIIMYKIIGSRGIGKTTQLIDYAARNGYKILCNNSFSYEHMKDRVISLGYDPGMVEPLSSYKSLTENNIKFVVDDLDVFLSNLTNGNLYGFTLTLQ